MTAPDTGLNFGELYGKHGGEAEPLPEGNYDVVVESAKAQSSKDGSKPQLQVVFKIVDHPKFSNRKLTNTFTVTTTSEVAMNIFFRQMHALGFDGQFWAANPTNPLPTVAAQAPGRRARVQVKLEEYQGVARPRIKNVMEGSGVASGLGGGLPPAPGGLTPPPPVAVPSVQQLMQPPAPVAPPVAAPAPVAPPVAAPAPVAPPVAPVPPVVEAPVPPVVEAPAPVAEPAPAVQEQTPAPAPAAPVQEQAAPAPAQESLSTVPPAPAVPF